MSSEIFEISPSHMQAMDSGFSRVRVSRSGRIRVKKNNHRSVTSMDISEYAEISHNHETRKDQSSVMHHTRLSSNEENLVPLSEYASTPAEVKDDTLRRASLQSEQTFVSSILNGAHLTYSRKRNSDCDSTDWHALQRSSHICNGYDDNTLVEVRSKIAKYQLNNDDETIPESARCPAPVTNTTERNNNHIPTTTGRKSFVTKLSMKNARKPHDNEDRSPSPDVSFEEMLKSKTTVQAFREFLQSEYSEENLDFWLECEQFKHLKGAKLERAAFKIFAQYMARSALREINIDSSIRLRTQERLKNPDKNCFVEAQNCIYTLMRSDPFRRFIMSDKYQKLQESNDGFRMMLKRTSTKKK